MASRKVYPTSKEISCPLCSKTMLLKNWKDHCQTKHPMILSDVNLKKEYIYEISSSIESRGSCLDNFSLHVEAATASISKTVQDFDFQSFRILINSLQQYEPTVNATAHSTRCRRQGVSTTAASEDINEDELRD